MAILNFTDVLEKVGLNPNEVKLIRHTSSEAFEACCAKGMEREFTAKQRPGFSKSYPYWVTFRADGGTYARLLSCYRVHGSVPDTPDVCPEGLPDCEAKTYDGKDVIYDLEYLDVLKEYEGKLVIDWGKSVLMWHQKATNEKPIVAIAPKAKKSFPGFENLILSFNELEEVVKNETDYEQWRVAMSSVYAIYLVIDKKTGEQYVGSAYGDGGLWGRWSEYVATGGHGNNKLMVEHLKDMDSDCCDLQFSVLQILSKALADKEVIEQFENRWKEKLLTKDFGLNAN